MNAYMNAYFNRYFLTVLVLSMLTIGGCATGGGTASDAAGPDKVIYHINAGLD